MRVLILLLILPVVFLASPVLAADAKTGFSAGDQARPENSEPPTTQSPSNRAERPTREAVKMSPTIRVSPLRPDEDGKMHRVAPARHGSPLLNMPTPIDMSSPRGGENPGTR